MTNCIRFLGNICTTPLCGICEHAIGAVTARSGKGVDALLIQSSDFNQTLTATDQTAGDYDFKFFYVRGGNEWAVKGIASKNRVE